jgi:hypothetical protein
VIVYFTISAMACVSPPPSCVRDCVDPTSKQLLEVCGKIMMNPRWFATVTMLEALLNMALAFPPQ